MFEWLTGNVEQGGKTGLNILWNIFCGGIMATIFAWPLALIKSGGDGVEFFEYLFKPFG